MDNELWAPALLLSSYINVEMYQKVMSEFTRRSFRVGTPLRTIYFHNARKTSVETILDNF